MEPNGYQKKVLRRLREYLRLLETHSPADAYRALWESYDVIISPLRDDKHKWAEVAGENFRYYMVFDELNWKKEGAYDLSEFLGVMGRL